MMSDQHFSDESIVISYFVPPSEDDQKKVNPVTIYQVLQACCSKEDPVLIEGKASVSLVAHVTSVKINAARASFVLEDGTGKIWADKDFTSIVHELGAKAEEEEIAQCNAFEHTYVEIMGMLKKNNSKWRPKVQIKSIHPIHGYHQVMYHILNVMHRSMLSQQCNQPYDTSQDFVPSEDVINMPVDDGSQANQSNASNQPLINTPSASHSILPNTFSPQRHQPYATLKPIERAIMRYMLPHRGHQVLIAELSQAIQASYECTDFQFNLAFQALLSEAYLTSPLDDGYVIVTPRQ